MALPPAVTIHALHHAQAALSLHRPVLLLSAPGAALYAGVLWWRALIAAASPNVADATPPDAIDCADAPGRALEALAVDCAIVILARCPAWPSVAGRAAAAGALLLDARPPELDLAAPAALRRLPAWLGAA